jgi:uncharacterized protein
MYATRSRLVPFALSLLILLVPAVRAAAEAALEGHWIGGFKGATDVVAVDVRFEAGDDGLTGELSLPQRAEWNIDLTNVRQRGHRVSFELPGAGGNLLFEGRLRDDGRVTGSVRQGQASTSFELIRVVTPAADHLRGVYGTYERPDGQVFLVAPGDGQPIYVDYASGRTGMLYSVGGDRLIGGPTMGTGYPVALEVAVSRGPSGHATAVRLTRGRASEEAVRRTYYVEEPVSFPSGDVTIDGTLLRPVGAGPFPAIVMIHGSGPVTRHALRPFADHFARNGVAVLITDKRGAGRSTGTWARATFDDLAADALAGVALLRARADILQNAIGLQGQSLGAYVAPLAAGRSRDVAFVVVEAAPTLTPLEHERLRVQSQLRADGFEPTQIAQAVALLDHKFDVARSGAGWARLESALASARDETWLPYINPPTSLDSLRWYWEHVFSYDPLPALTALRVPLLVLYGELDAIVPPKVHRKRMEQALSVAGPAHVTIREFERANHGFFESITGGRNEHPRLTGFVGGYFETRTGWVLARVREATRHDASLPGVEILQD